MKNKINKPDCDYLCDCRFQSGGGYNALPTCISIGSVAQLVAAPFLARDFYGGPSSILGIVKLFCDTDSHETPCGVSQDMKWDSLWTPMEIGTSMGLQ